MVVCNKKKKQCRPESTWQKQWAGSPLSLINIHLWPLKFLQFIANNNHNNIFLNHEDFDKLQLGLYIDFSTIDGNLIFHKKRKKVKKWEKDQKKSERAEKLNYASIDKMYLMSLQLLSELKST